MRNGIHGRTKLNKQQNKLNVELLKSKTNRKKEYKVEPLVVDTVRPLVDLAYWSSFVEVRRDCAAAFATLSMNSENLDVLSRSGNNIF